MPNPAIHDNDDRGRNIIKRWDAAGAARGSLDSVCEEIARRILPNYAGSFSSVQLHSEEMYDATGALAFTRFAAAMESMLTPRNSNGTVSSRPIRAQETSERAIVVRRTHPKPL
jgi:hypothetical protein